MTSLTERLKAASAKEHTSAERHPFLSALISGYITPERYVRYLQGLSSTYQALEKFLQEKPELVAIADRYALYRYENICRDIADFQGKFDGLNLRNPQNEYAAHIESLADSWPNGLIAHFYTRYLGDLSGGQMIGKFVQKAFSLTEEFGTHFYRFEAVEDARSAKEDIKLALDNIVLEEAECKKLEAECVQAFKLSKRLFDQAWYPEETTA